MKRNILLAPLSVLLFLFCSGMSGLPPVDEDQHRWDLKNWMADAWYHVGDKTLYEITVPSSHDAGTYSLDRDSLTITEITSGLDPFLNLFNDLDIVQDIVYGSSVTHEVDIYTQLVEGNRSLDIRFKRDPKTDELSIFHGIFGTDPDDIFNQIARFLDETTNEVVVMELNCGGYLNLDEQDKVELVQVLGEILGSYMADPAELSIHSTLQEFVEAGTRLIVKCKDDYLYLDSRIWSAGELPMNGKWIPTSQMDVLYDGVMEHYVAECRDRQEYQAIYNSSIQLSFAPADIGEVLLEAVFTGTIGLLYDLQVMVDENREGIRELIVDLGSAPEHRMPNSISRDFYNQDEIYLTILKNFGYNSDSVGAYADGLMEDGSADAVRLANLIGDMLAETGEY